MQKQQGFTLIEILIAMAILAIVAAFAMPSFRTSINNSQVRSTSNEVAALFRYARVQAMQNSQTVVVGAIGNDGNIGTAGNTGLAVWLENGANTAFNSGTDEELRRIRYEGDLSFKMLPNLSAVAIAGNGFLSNLTSGSTQLQLSICIDNSSVSNRIITMLQSGIVGIEDGGSC